MSTTAISMAPTSAASRRATRLIRRQRVREYFAFDAAAYHHAVALGGVAAGLAALAAGRGREAMKLLGKVHRSAYSPLADGVVERVLAGAWSGSRFGQPLCESLRPDRVELFVDGPARKFVTNPAGMLGPLAMVVRSPRPDSKGILVLQYNYVFPLFRRFFDVERVAEQYHLVLEPSWSGYCNPEVLCYAALKAPVFVQAYEPRDRAFVTGLGASLVSVPLAANWWVDHRIFRPLPQVTKDADLVMVAGWGDYKRHASFFRAIAPLRRWKPDLRIILVGYGLGLTADDIRGIAAHFGLADAIEIFENLTQEQVNVQFNRARVNVLWSRREGVNKAIIEGMFAGLPCVIREGFNYGHRYEYVNQCTGAYATEATLSEVTQQLLAQSGAMRPREWVMQHMAPEVSTRILADTIAEHAGERVTETSPMAVKFNGLHGMYYWDPSDEDRFAADYEYLRQSVLALPVT